MHGGHAQGHHDFLELCYVLRCMISYVLCVMWYAVRTTRGVPFALVSCPFTFAMTHVVRVCHIMQHACRESLHGACRVTGDSRAYPVDPPLNTGFY